MKTLLNILILFCLPIAVSAQLNYESDYVSDGKTFSINLPKGYFDLGGDEAGMDFFCRDKNASLTSEKAPERNAVILAMMPFNYGAELNDEMAEMMMLELMGEFISEETIVDLSDRTTNNNQYFHIGSAMTEADEDIGAPMLMNVGITSFGDILFLVYWFDFERKNDNSEFNKMLNSFKIFETDKENGFDISTYDEEEYFEEPYLDSYFKNELYESKFDYTMIFFEVELAEDLDNPTWQEDWEYEYPELMVAYQKTRFEEVETFVEGGVKVFSGGNSANYSTESSKLDAVQNVFGEYDITSLLNKRTTTKGGNQFEKYDVSYVKGDSDKPSVLYTLNYGGETFFFLVYETEFTSPAFQKSAEEFVTSFIVL